MKKVIFSTGNAEKFLTAKHVCELYDIQLTQKSSDIVEIQSENPEIVALDKASKAFALFKKPVVITDDSWAFSGLKGFPGVYMHSINAWFTPEDFLRNKPEEVLRWAIHGMLPKNRLGSQYNRNVFIYAGENHEQEAQKPKKIDLDTIKA